MGGRMTCQAKRRDKTPCRSLVFDDETFCAHHRELAEQFGADTVVAGEYPRLPRKKGKLETGAAADDEPPAPAVLTVNGHSLQLDPGEVRPALARGAAGAIEQIRTSLLKAATDSERGVWTTIQCKFCSKSGRYAVQVPDVRARVAATQLLLQEGLGKPPQAPDHTPRLPQTVLEARKLKWAEVEHLVAVHFASDVQRVLALGGRGALRERIMQMPLEVREILREELAA